MVDPTTAVLGLAHALRGHGPLSRDEAAFLAERLEGWAVAKGALTLDQALGLRQRGGVSAAQAIRLAERDAMLRRLWRSFPKWCDLSPMAAARLMCLSASDYEARRWRRERDHISAPPDQPAATWWSILQKGAVPGSRQIARILDGDIQSGV